VRRYIVATIPVLALLAMAVPASAEVVTCKGLGGFELNKANIEYGRCNTTETSGAGSLEFSASGREVALRALAEPGSEQVASTWYSYEAVAATKVCVGVDVIGTEYRGKHKLRQELRVSTQTGALFSKNFTVRFGGNYLYCRKLPRGTSLKSWQLLTTADAKPRTGVAGLSERLETVTIT